MKDKLLENLYNQIEKRINYDIDYSNRNTDNKTKLITKDENYKYFKILDKKTLANIIKKYFTKYQNLILNYASKSAWEMTKLKDGNYVIGIKHNEEAKIPSRFLCIIYKNGNIEFIFPKNIELFYNLNKIDLNKIIYKLKE